MSPVTIEYIQAGIIIIVCGSILWKLIYDGINAKKSDPILLSSIMSGITTCNRNILELTETTYEVRGSVNGLKNEVTNHQTNCNKKFDVLFHRTEKITEKINKI